MEQNKRPTLSDPVEYALIKSIYFKEDGVFNEDMDPLEALERQESKFINSKKSAR